jgi:hypothetical protein
MVVLPFTDACSMPYSQEMFGLNWLNNENKSSNYIQDFALTKYKSRRLANVKSYCFSVVFDSAKAKILAS